MWYVRTQSDPVLFIGALVSRALEESFGFISFKCHGGPRCTTLPPLLLPRYPQTPHSTRFSQNLVCFLSLFHSFCSSPISIGCSLFTNLFLVVNRHKLAENYSARIVLSLVSSPYNLSFSFIFWPGDKGKARCGQAYLLIVLIYAFQWSSSRMGGIYEVFDTKPPSPCPHSVALCVSSSIKAPTTIIRPHFASATGKLLRSLSACHFSLNTTTSNTFAARVAFNVPYERSLRAPSILDAWMRTFFFPTADLHTLFSAINCSRDRDQKLYLKALRS